MLKEACADQSPFSGWRGISFLVTARIEHLALILADTITRMKLSASSVKAG